MLKRIEAGQVWGLWILIYLEISLKNMCWIILQNTFSGAWVDQIVKNEFNGESSGISNLSFSAS